MSDEFTTKIIPVSVPTIVLEVTSHQEPTSSGGMKDEWLFATYPVHAWVATIDGHEFVLRPLVVQQDAAQEARRFHTARNADWLLVEEDAFLDAPDTYERVLRDKLAARL